MEKSKRNPKRRIRHEELFRTAIQVDKFTTEDYFDAIIQDPSCHERYFASTDLIEYMKRKFPDGRWREFKFKGWQEKQFVKVGSHCH